MKSALQAVVLGLALGLVSLGGDGFADPGVLAAPQAVSKADVQSFNSFWGPFRRAAIARDLAAVQHATRFPMQLRGTLDEEPTQYLGPDRFATVFPKLMAADTGLTAAGETVHQYFQRKTQVQRTDFLGPRVVRLADMVFERTARGWQLTMAYQEEE